MKLRQDIMIGATIISGFLLLLAVLYPGQNPWWLSAGIVIPLFLLSLGSCLIERAVTRRRSQSAYFIARERVAQASIEARNAQREYYAAKARAARGF